MELDPAYEYRTEVHYAPGTLGYESGSITQFNITETGVQVPATVERLRKSDWVEKVVIYKRPRVRDWVETEL